MLDPEQRYELAFGLEALVVLIAPARREVERFEALVRTLERRGSGLNRHMPTAATLPLPDWRPNEISTLREKLALLQRERDGLDARVDLLERELVETVLSASAGAPTTRAAVGFVMGRPTRTPPRVSVVR